MTPDAGVIDAPALAIAVLFCVLAVLKTARR